MGNAEGHFIMGKHRIKQRLPDGSVFLDCGCALIVQLHDPDKKLWTLLLDYSQCRN